MYLYRGLYVRKRKSFKYILKQLKGSWWLIWLAAVFIIFGAFFEFLGPKLIGVTVDSVMGTAPFDMPQTVIDYIENLGGRAFLQQHLYVLIGVFALVAILTALCEMGRLYASHNLGEKHKAANPGKNNSRCKFRFYFFD